MADFSRVIDPLKGANEGGESENRAETPGSDGQLTVSNLAKEAGVSRATANRAEAVLVEFHNHTIALQETPEKLPGLCDQNRELERRLAQVTSEKNQIIAGLQATVTLLAQQVQALTLKNERLRTSAMRSTSNVTELPRR